MLNLIISCDDPIERLLYGEPDPWLGLMMPRHDADGRGHTHHGSSLDDVIAQDQGYGGGGNSSGDAWSYSEPYNSDGYDGSDDAIGSGSGGGGGSDDFGPADADGYEGPSPSFTTGEPDRPQTPAERDFDAFLIRRTRTAAGDDFESGPSGAAGPQKGLEAGPDTLLRSPDGEDDDRAEIEALIISRGRALGLTDQQIAQALTRYRTGRVTSAARPDQTTAGLGAATDPATALLGAGAGSDNTASPQSAPNSDGQPDTPVPAGPRVNPEYEAWQARTQAPRYLKGDGTPVDIDVGNWFPGKETLAEYAARQGVDVVLNPNYVEPGERPNQYLDGSGQPVPETWEQAVAAYQRDAETLRRDAARYETEADAYRTDFDAYEAAANAWNENPGSAAELKALQDRRESLATERARLSASADTINARAQVRQAAAQNLNDLAKLKPGRQRNSVIHATAGPPEVREARYREAVERYEAAKNAPSIVYEYDDGEYIEGSLAKGRARRDNINQAKIELALTAVASGRPVPDGLRVSGTYRTASLSGAATLVELAQTVKQWQDNESAAERSDDADGGGGGREYDVADDGTVSYTEGDHTYTVRDDDLARDVREAATSGDASGLSSVDQVTVSDDSGNVVATNFQQPESDDGGAAATPAGMTAAEIAEIQAYNAALLASADDLGIGYDDRHPDFEQIRADVQERADQQNRDYVNYFLGADTVSQETAPTQEQVDQASEVAADVASLGRTSAPSQARVAADIGAQNREYVNFYLPGTVPEGTAPTQEQIDQASEVADDVGSLGRTSAPSQARVAADIGAQNREYVNFYLPGTVPEGTAPTQEQIEQAIEQQQRNYNAVAGVDAGGVGDAAIQAGIEQQRNYNAVAGVDAGGVGDAAVQAGIEQQRNYNAVAGVDAGGVGDAAVQAGIEQQRAADERMASDLGLPADTSPEGVQQAARARAEEIEQGFRDNVLDTAPAPGSFVSSVLDSQIDAGGLPRNHPDFPEYDRIRTALDGPHWRREQIADSTQQLLEDTTVGSLDVGPAWDAFRAIGTGRHVSQFDSSVPIDANLGLVPVAGTLADLNVRGRDGYSKGDIAWIAGMGALDVVPIPLAKGGRLLVAAPKLARGGILGDAVTGTRNILGAGTGRPSFVNINRLTEPGPGMIQPTRYYTAAPDAPRIHQGTVDQQFAAERFRNLEAFTERYPDGPPPDVPLPDTSRDLMNWKALERRLDPTPLHLDTVALEKSVGRTGWPLGIDIGEGSIRTTEPSILARRRPGHFSASPVDLSKPGRTGQLIQEPYFVDAAGNVRPVATSPWGGLWTTASHAAVEWSDRTSGGIHGDSHNVFHIVNPKADVTQALAGSQKISRTVWDEQELRLIEADRGFYLP